MKQTPTVVEPAQQHDWHKTGVAWSPRTSADSYEEERRCQKCGARAIFGNGRPLRQEACPAALGLADKTKIDDR
jgi:hypothetical protein